MTRGCVQLGAVMGPLMGGGGGAMSHVDLKKWQRRMSLSLISPNVTCRI